MLVGVVDEQPRVLHHGTGFAFAETAEDVLDALEAGVRQGLEAQPDAAAVGLGIPCTIDRERGLAVSAVNLPLVDVPIRDEMSTRLGLPVFVDNDANMAALAEHRFGAARDTRNAVMLTIGTGVGGGLVLDGELYRGSTGAGAELGHVVVDADGPPCQGNCPNRGCVETMTSGTALAREGRVAAEREPASALGQLAEAGEPIDGRAVVVAALAEDPAACELVDRAGHYLGVALAGFANVFEPEVMVIGGGVMAAGELLLAPARAEVRRRALPPQNETPVVAAELGAEAGMVGAAVMALEESGGHIDSPRAQGG
jgi:glucokinase